MKLYYSSAEEAAKHWHGVTITEIFDNTHEEYCRKILENSEYISVGSKHFCELTHEIGKVTIRLYKDADGTFYDYCEYQVLRKNAIVVPILRTPSTPKEVWERFFTKLIDIKYEVVSFRKYGQPKLDKPKELRGIKGVSVEYIPKRCTNQYFVLGNDLWIKSRDYFSPSYCRAEDIGTPLEYRIAKYGIDSKKNSGFIYDDCWGDIVLRQEAWIKFTNIVPYAKIIPYTELAETAMEKIQAYHHFNDGLDYYWRSMLEKIFKQIAEKA